MSDLFLFTHVDLQIRNDILHRIHTYLTRYQTVRSYIPPEIYQLFLDCMNRFMSDIVEIQTSQRLREFAPSIHNGLDEVERILWIHIAQNIHEINTDPRYNI